MADIFIMTYGCTANQDNTAIIKGILAKNGHKLVENADNADVVVINSCIVKSVTANKIKSAIAKFKNKKMIVTGCMPESEKKLLKQLAPNASIVNTFYVTSINEVINCLLHGENIDLLGKRKENKTGLPKMFEKNKVSMQIAEGCASFCSFCETKLAKGQIKSTDEEKLIAELKRYVSMGYRTINITSTDNGCYGFDINTNLPCLLKKLVAINGNFSLRIGMMNPEHVLGFLDELIDVYKSQKIMKFIHIPVQSGSNKVLNEMNRGYAVKDFKRIITKFRKEIPGINISTDIIVGYPTEAEQDFNKTLELIKETRPEVLNISKYGPRPGTKAAKLKQIPTWLVKERSRILTKEFKKIKIKN